MYIAHGKREVSLGTTRRRLAVLAGAGLVLGGVGGAAADVVVHMVGLISNLALLHRFGWQLPDLRHYHPTPLLLAVAVGGALVVVGLARWSPIIRGHGIPESLEAILFRDSRVQPRAALAKPVSAAVAMGTGGPFGAEGPIIVTGASVGSLLGQLVPVSPAERRILLAVGAAAGMAGVFATPVAAVVLAFELLLFERSLRALVPLVLATSVATTLHDVLLAPHPLFAVVHPLAFHVGELPLFAVLGVPAGALAVLLNRGLFAVEAGFRRLPIPEWTHPVIGALGFGAVGLAVPGSLSVGYWAITDAVNGRFLLGAAAVLFAGKMVSWWLGLGSNTSGGTLAPMFLVGATMGEMVGIGFAHAFPAAHIQPGAFALVAMGATFGVGARALLTGAVFAAEVTGAYSMLVPLLLATAVAELVAELGLDDRVMTDKLRRRGYRIDFDTQTGPLRMRVAAQVMEPVRVAAHGGGMADGDGTAGGAEVTGGDGTACGTLPEIDGWAHLSDAMPLLLQPDTPAVAVTDHGQVVGTLTRAQIDAELRRRIADEQLQAAIIGPWAAYAARRGNAAGSEEGLGNAAGDDELEKTAEEGADAIEEERTEEVDGKGGDGNGDEGKGDEGKGDEGKGDERCEPAIAKHEPAASRADRAVARGSRLVLPVMTRIFRDGKLRRKPDRSAD
ncbi:MAG: chloride channel protein [Actinomycetota bacterium]|nr:chloride channel protein [Actinomycetota bacterium]